MVGKSLREFFGLQVGVDRQAKLELGCDQTDGMLCMGNKCRVFCEIRLYPGRVAAFESALQIDVNELNESLTLSTSDSARNVLSAGASPDCHAAVKRSTTDLCQASRLEFTGGSVGLATDMIPQRVVSATQSRLCTPRMPLIPTISFSHHLKELLTNQAANVRDTRNANVNSPRLREPSNRHSNSEIGDRERLFRRWA